MRILGLNCSSLLILDFYTFLMCIPRASLDRLLHTESQLGSSNFTPLNST